MKKAGAIIPVMRMSIVLALAMHWASEQVVQGALSITFQNQAYTENFDSLANSGTGSTVPTGWAFAESGTSGAANGLYTANTGSTSLGDTYSFGATLSTERALGELTTGTLQSTFGIEILNSSASAISSFAISYVGEQWRLGALLRTDRLNFQYSLNATELGNGTWTDVDALDFIAPVTSGTVGLLDGNASANRLNISSDVSGISVTDGGTIWFRWVGFDATGADDCLAIDDFSITAVPEPAEWGIISAGGLLAIAGFHSWRQSKRRRSAL